MWSGTYALEDTIAAVATGERGGAVGLIRVSGPGSWRVVLSLVEGGLERVEPRRAYVRWLRDEAGAPLDQVVLLFYKGPASLTGEDVVEVFCHSGRGNVGRVLDAILRSGARQAGPGEFTLRGFLRGKLDLVQAEAVAALVEAESKEAAGVAARILRGELSGRIEALRRAIRELRVALEAELEFPDEDVEVDVEAVAERLREIREELEGLVGSYEVGRRLRRGARVVLVGRTNVGKSSLLNRLLGRERVVVDSSPGTTRDFVEAGRVVGGRWVVFVDTAGWRKDAVGVEARAFERGMAEVEGADLVVFVVDGARGVEEEDEWLWRRVGGQGRVVVVNKADLVGGAGRREVQERVRALCGREALWVSALTGEGVEELVEEVARQLGRESVAGAVVVEERQARLLRRALGAVDAALRALGVGWDLVAEELRESERALGEVLGEGVDMDVLREIFSRFCIGK